MYSSLFPYDNVTISRVIAQVLQLRAAKWSYFSPENAMELIAYLGSILLVMDFSQCQQDTGIRTVSGTTAKVPTNSTMPCVAIL